jgi:hypothetical protein
MPGPMGRTSSTSSTDLDNYSEAGSVHRLLDAAIAKRLGRDEPDAVVYVRANEEWGRGGIARLALGQGEIGPGL